jgi:lysophospholipase L1-like esterase
MVAAKNISDPNNYLIQPTEPVKYSCVRYDLNVISPETDKSLYRFYQKLDNYLAHPKGKINILHIGDSHIQADYLTGTTRQLLQNTFGNGGRGFIFPYRIAESNNPHNLDTYWDGVWKYHKSVFSSDNGNYGLAGISVSTADSNASLFINPNKLRDMNYEFNKIRLFYLEQEQNFGIVFNDGGSMAFLYDEQPIAPGISDIFFDNAKDSIWMSFEKSFQFQTTFQLFGMSLENEYPGILYHAAGLNGAKASTFLRSQFLESQMQALKPDLVILSFGTNDGYMSRNKFCEECFRDSYRNLLLKVKTINPDASILITTPNDNFIRARQHNGNTKKMVEVLYQLAEEYDAAIWDLYKVMGGDYSMRFWQREGLTQKDLVHFSPKGYVLQGQLLYDALMLGFEKRFDRE